MGRYRFDFDAAMENHWREKLRAEMNDEVALEAALGEVRAEAEGAEIEIGDGWIASRSRGKEFYRVPLAMDGDTARFEKPTGARVELHFEGALLVADEPGKPRMHFVRLEARA